jgi:hypothetical protein
MYTQVINLEDMKLNLRYISCYHDFLKLNLSMKTCLNVDVKEKVNLPYDRSRQQRVYLGN